MALKIAFHILARQDLRAITQYISERNRDSVVAERFAQRLLDRCHDLTKAPGMGGPYRQRPDVKKVNEGAYKILYTVSETEITVLRIWDGRRGTTPRF